jgi:two-component system, NarL family, nitrate/nitrite response regulator NarL
MMPGGKNMASHPDSQIRVMLVDAHRIVLSGLTRLIDDERPELQVVATATECAEAVEVAAAAKPDVIVLDVGLACEKEAGVVPPLINGRHTRVLLLSGTRDGKHESAILRGACGVVHKDDSAETLIKAIKKVHEGQLWLDRSTTGRLFVELSRQKSQAGADPAKRKIASLTVREHDVVRTLVTQPGADNKTLASSLHIGEHTLRNHLSRIYDKLDVPNRLELYVFAQRHVFNGQSIL